MAVSDYQALFNGLLVGAGTIYQFETIDGLEDFDVRGNDALLPNLWGVQAGADFVNGRTITLGFWMAMQTGGELAFEQAFVPTAQVAPTVLSPLVIKMLNRPELMVMCRVRRRAHPRSMAEQNFVSHWLVQLDAPDPRLYANALSQLAAPAFVTGSDKFEYTAGSGAGAAFDYTAGSGAGAAFDYTGVPAVGRVNARNNGNVDTYPAFLVTNTSGSQVNTFRLTNETTGESATFVFPLTAGGTVAIDMAGVATGAAVAPVVTSGTPNYPAWQPPRAPIRLAPGNNSLIFAVLDGPTAGPSCQISWRDAYL